MEEIQIEYSQNEAKFLEISNMFRNVTDASFYSTQIKIAAKEYAKYLNNMIDEGVQVMNTNTGHNSGGTFVIMKNNQYVVNEKFVQKCIKNAHKKSMFMQFGFSKVNIVLDKLMEALSSRN